MEWDVVEARVLEHGCIYVKFSDGLQGTVRFNASAYRGVFAKLRDPAEFNKLRVNGYFITWPGELDLAPDAMHEAIKQQGEWVLD
jgi:hypothetical protein